MKKFEVIDGGQTEDNPLSAYSYTEPGLEVVFNHNIQPVFIIDESFDKVPVDQLSHFGALVRLGLQDDWQKYAPDEAAQMIKIAMDDVGMLNAYRRRQLDGIGEVIENAPSVQTLCGWLERWWVALKG